MLAQIKTIINKWFLFESPVSQKFYLFSGISLMLFKYISEAVLVYGITGNVLTPFEYLSPLGTTRKSYTNSDSFLLWFLAIWTLPFLWIGISMTVRRAENAGHSPWLGLLFFVPIINFMAMLILATAPEKTSEDNSIQQENNKQELSQVSYILINAAIGISISLAIVAVSILMFGQYGASLFFGTPFMIGLSTGYFTNRTKNLTFSQTASHAGWSLFCASAALLVSGIEGIVCIAMAFPIALVAAFMGSYIGRYFANRKKIFNQHAFLSIGLIPLTVFVESSIIKPQIYEVVTSIKISAPPEKVWENVIGFSKIPNPPGIILSSGIAYPLKARIEGSGVGAIRYCEFTTGPFVEPITAWEPPFRLAFDVIKHPPAMQEWSPYRNLHPPHVDGYFKSEKGEFRLKGNPDGSTLLEGSTWYRLNIFPAIYWKIWSQYLVHHIHFRVLNHIKNISEN